MCLLALYFHSLEDYPLAVAANRDEALARPSAPPQILNEKPLIYGGKDLQSGGTWLGVNEYGVLVGILNRRPPIEERESLRSRGLLCLDLLAAPSAAEACRRLRAHEPFFYRPFNLVFADAGAAYIAWNEVRRIDFRRLEKGLHIFGNAPIDGPQTQKLDHAFRLFAGAGKILTRNAIDPLGIQALQVPLGDHGGARYNGPKDAICVHTPSYGTVSSSLLFYHRKDKRFTTYYAPGPPCQNCYTKGLSI